MINKLSRSPTDILAIHPILLKAAGGLSVAPVSSLQGASSLPADTLLPKLISALARDWAKAVKPSGVLGTTEKLSFKGITVQAFRTQRAGFDHFEFKPTPTDLPQFYISKQALGGTDTEPLSYFVYYSNSVFFPSTLYISQSNSTGVFTAVIDGVTEGSVLPAPVTYYLPITSTNITTECGWYNFNTSARDWSLDGCRQIEQSKFFVTCECTVGCLLWLSIFLFENVCVCVCVCISYFLLFIIEYVCVCVCLFAFLFLSLDLTHSTYSTTIIAQHSI